MISFGPFVGPVESIPAVRWSVRYTRAKARGAVVGGVGLMRSRFSTLIAVALVASALALPLGTAEAAPAPMSLGTVTATSRTPKNCPAGFSCTTFSVQCPDVRAVATGTLARADARGTLRGVAAFFSGGNGRAFWSDGSDNALPFLGTLQAAGLRVFQVRWDSPSWLASSSGEQAGPARLACRPASVIKWLHDANPVPSSPGRCGFCISGQSAGASQVSYALARYGLDSIVSVMVPTSGPPHADIAQGCLSSAGTPGNFPPKSSGALMDLSYGYAAGGGPCARQDRSFASRWNADGVDDNGDYFYPSTSVVFVFGDRDTNPADPHARKYVAQLRAAHSPDVTVVTIHCMTHGVQDSADGLAAMRAALLGRPVSSTSTSAACPGKGKATSSGGGDSAKSSTAKEKASISGVTPTSSRSSSREWLIILAVAIIAFLFGATARWRNLHFRAEKDAS